MINRLLLRPDWITILAAGLAVAAIVVWFVVRKRQQTLWLPTLRILDLEARRLPRLRWRLPPWLPFLCFLISALTAVGLSFRPRQLRMNEYNTSNSRQHLLVDLSPSVAARMTNDEVAQLAKDTWNQVSADAKVSISTTHSPNFIEPQNGDEVFELIRQAGFHRAGVKLGEAIREMVEQIRGIDGLIVLSDFDKHSWDGFNWRTLLDEIAISRVAVGAERHQLPNVYIASARVTATGSAKIEWDVELFRINSAGALSGTMNAAIEGESIASVDWSLPIDQNRTVVRITLPQQKAKALLASGQGDDRMMTFSIAPAGENDLPLDDVYRTRLAWHGSDAMLIAESIGERALEDPTYHFEASLGVLGFDVRRYESGSTKALSFVDQAMWFVIGGRASSLNYCPDVLETERLARMAQPTRARSETNVWLVPASVDADWRGLCHCISRLVVGQKSQPAPPEFCQDVDGRGAWIELLKSIGGKQIGGAVGAEGDAIAWQFQDARTKFRVLALTLPLSPNPQLGMSYARIPVILKSLLEFQGIVRKGRELVVAEEWPRIESIASVWRSAGEPGDRGDSQLSNVPLGESLMAEQSDMELPPLWNDRGTLGRISAAAREDQSDPWPFVKWANIAVALMLAMEFAARLLRRWNGRRRAVAALLLGCMGWAWLPQDEAQAQVEVITVDRSAPRDGTVSNLAMEVESRTSIELSRTIRNFATLGTEALREPWLWVNDSSQLVGGDGKFKPEVASWLYRGGFLVLPGKFSDDALKALTSAMLTGRRDHGEWTPIPPDHELMRSFYLLDALPECDGQIWKGFQFDGRIAIIQPPFNLLGVVKDMPDTGSCAAVVAKEQAVRIFVNITMVALATDYKKDQIHLPEILKRLR